MNPNLIALAVELADSAARSDIECYCASAGHDGRPGEPGYLQWYDTTDIEDVCTPEDIQRALQYLELRGSVMRHPVNPAFVSFPRQAQQAAAA